MVFETMQHIFLSFFLFFHIFLLMVRLHDRQTCYTVHTSKLIKNLVTVELAYTYSYVHTQNVAENVHFYENPRRGDPLVLYSIRQKSRKLF